MVDPGSQVQKYSINELAQDRAKNMPNSQTLKEYQNSKEVMPALLRAIGNDV